MLPAPRANALRLAPALASSRVVRALVVLDALVLSLVAGLRYRAGVTHFYDLGIFDNVVWQAAHGRLFTYPQYEMSYFGDHFAPILFLFVAPYRLVPHPVTLVVIQSVALALGALPLASIVRHVLADPRRRPRPLDDAALVETATVAFAVAYFVNVSLLHVATFDFHPIAFAIPLSLCAFEAALSDRPRRFALACALLLACQEETAITVATFGLYLVVFAEGRPWKRRGAILVAVAAVWFLVVMKLVIPAFQKPTPHKGWVYLTRYAHLGSSMGEVLRMIVLHPLATIARSYAPYKLTTLCQLLLPLGLLPLLGARVLLVALPALFYGYISARESQFQIEFQYFSTSLGWLFAAAACGLRTFARVVEPLAREAHANARLRRFALVLAPLAFALSAALHYDDQLRPIRADFLTANPNQRQLDEVRAIVGPDASISTTNNLGAWFSRRREIYLSLDFIHNKDLKAALSLPDYHPSRFVLFDLSDLSSSEDREKRVLALLRDPGYGVRYLDFPLLLLEAGWPHRPLPALEATLAHVRLSDRVPGGTFYSPIDLVATREATLVMRLDEADAAMRYVLADGASSTVFGPYVTLGAGHYRATFDLRLATKKATGSADVVAEIDVASAQGRRLHAKADVTIDDLARAAATTGVPLEFDLPAETRLVELRTHTRGVGLAVSGVTLERLGPPRAGSAR